MKVSRQIQACGLQGCARDCLCHAPRLTARRDRAAHPRTWPFVLRRDCGDTWRLEAPREASGLIGQRVRVIGIRADFDLLDVAHIEAVARTASDMD